MWKGTLGMFRKCFWWQFVPSISAMSYNKNGNQFVPQISSLLRSAEFILPPPHPGLKEASTIRSPSLAVIDWI